MSSTNKNPPPLKIVSVRSINMAELDAIPGSSSGPTNCIVDSIDSHNNSSNNNLLTEMDPPKKVPLRKRRTIEKHSTSVSSSKVSILDTDEGPLTHSVITKSSSSSTTTTTINHDLAGGPMPRLSRRKSVHKSLLTDTQDMEFLEGEPYDQTSNDKPSENSELEHQIKMIKSIESPNKDWIEKVAFLRGCINYMMEELNNRPILFNRTYSLQELKDKYLANKQ